MAGYYNNVPAVFFNNLASRIVTFKKKVNSKTLAKSFVERFCKTDLEGIDSLLSTQFSLKGPLFEFESKQDYIDSLDGNLEPDPEAEILSVTGDDNEATAFYRYRGNLIAQLFRCHEGKIVETVLVFDTKNMT